MSKSTISFNLEKKLPPYYDPFYTEFLYWLLLTKCFHVVKNSWDIWDGHGYVCSHLHTIRTFSETKIKFGDYVWLITQDIDISKYLYVNVRKLIFPVMHTYK